MTLVFSLGSLTSMAIAFVIGLLIGLLVKKIISVGLLLLALVLLLMAIGYIHPSFTATLINYFRYYGPKALEEAQRISSLIPYSSVFFIIGFIIGVWKG
ncbi:MAG: hypothetical protein ACP5T5_02640 [Thermoprotei archaeon]|nr:hypothetical protein [TACK group archaeon]